MLICSIITGELKRKETLMIDSSKYFKVLNRVGNRGMRLFCFPYAGGNTSIYLPFKDKMRDEIELVAVQLPGRAERMFEEAYTDMDMLIEVLYQQILPILDRPFAFCGYSMGGVIAYALTRKLEIFSQLRPRYLLMAATKPTQFLIQGRKHMLSDEALIEMLREHKASPEAVLNSKELMAMILPTIRADYELIETYQAPEDIRLETPLILFNSEEDMPKETIMQWQRFFNHEAKYVPFEGGHFFIHSHTDKMAEVIRDLHKEAEEA